MKRLFAFGCSFTGYSWPTWADILGSQFEHYENWGQCGASNHFIMNSLVECHLRNQLTKDDVVGIMWTNVSRLDSYKEKEWLTPGNIYNQPFYSKEMVDQFDTRGFYIRDLAFIYMADQLLEKIGCEYYMFSMVDIKNSLQYEHKDSSCQIFDLLPYYKTTLDKIRPSMHQIVFDYDWYSRPFQMEKQLEILKKHYQDLAGKDWPEFEKVLEPNSLKKLDRKIIKEIFNLNKWDWKKLFHTHRRTDPHPTPLEHLEYLTKMLPEYTISCETYKIIKEIDDALRKGQEVDYCQIQQLKNTPKRW